MCTQEFSDNATGSGRPRCRSAMQSGAHTPGARLPHAAAPQRRRETEMISVACGSPRSSLVSCALVLHNIQHTHTHIYKSINIDLHTLTDAHALFHTHYTHTHKPLHTCHTLNHSTHHHTQTTACNRAHTRLNTTCTPGRPSARAALFDPIDRCTANFCC